MSRYGETELSRALHAIAAPVIAEDHPQKNPSSLLPKDQIPRKSFFTATTGRRLSGAFHLTALGSIMVASGYACEFLLLVKFWVGAAIGMAIYGLVYTSSWLPDNDD